MASEFSAVPVDVPAGGLGGGPGGRASGGRQHGGGTRAGPRAYATSDDGDRAAETQQARQHDAGRGGTARHGRRAERPGDQTK
ncbi:hypothetical protein [Streptomyces sp. x-80]|uniref:hypothetical protein n=1 Tax=Streptomyces sp. x-80 TaxID=2789282 RepID=UPI0039808999